MTRNRTLHPDAAILAMVPEIEARRARCLALFGQEGALIDQTIKRCPPPAGRVDDATNRAWLMRANKVEKKLGLPAVEAEANKAEAELVAVLEQLNQTPARTLDGLLLKARMRQHHIDLGDGILADLDALAAGAPHATA